MMNRQTLAPMGRPAYRDRNFDMSRVVPFPQPVLILQQVIAAAKEVHLLGLDTLEGCKKHDNPR